MLTEAEPLSLWGNIFDDCLVLHAEHTMNASTFTGMITASTLADPYTVVASSIGALKGPLHGGANEEVVQMLKEIGEPRRVRSYLEEQLRAKRRLMGFGHRVYKVKDPRATILQGLCERLFKECGRSPLYEVAVEVERVAAELLKGKGFIPTSTSTPASSTTSWASRPICSHRYSLWLECRDGWPIGLNSFARTNCSVRIRFIPVSMVGPMCPSNNANRILIKATVCLVYSVYLVCLLERN